MANVCEGDRVYAQWGGRKVVAIVTRVTSTGKVYAKRWNGRRKDWTKPRRLYPWRGMWSVDELAE